MAKSGDYGGTALVQSCVLPRIFCQKTIEELNHLDIYK